MISTGPLGEDEAASPAGAGVVAAGVGWRFGSMTGADAGDMAAGAGALRVRMLASEAVLVWLMTGMADVVVGPGSGEWEASGLAGVMAAAAAGAGAGAVPKSRSGCAARPPSPFAGWPFAGRPAAGVSRP